MTDDWALDASDGELLIRTGVTGRAARMGHRLTIAMTRWHASVTWAGSEPAAAELTVEVESFDVLRGEGGVKGLTGPEKALVKSNAMKSLDASRYPEIRFTSEAIEKTDAGYRLAGALQIRGKSRDHEIDLRTEDLGASWRMTAESTVRQSEFGVKPYSLFMGSLRVADDVTISFAAVHAKGG
ncbi:YceI family protein [Mycobacterium sp. Marseille-P9652]|uniref:YceI family protein n=1 Tax=Mycobacterium sp. Marseille-P9652 TaxID=2654950 RepID=UPI0012E7507F|nr:YceI family protein [Mycobacterium sp. Marseille-P9652]